MSSSQAVSIAVAELYRELPKPEESTMKPIESFEVINHGIDYPDYFQGCGVSCTEFEDVATGIGNTEAEAFDDALESLAQMGWETDGFEDRAIAEYGEKPSTKPIPKRYGDDAYHYVSIRVR